MIGLTICIVLLAVCIVIMSLRVVNLKDRIEDIEKKFYRLADIHNEFVDCVADEFDDLYVELNERIDEINDEFHKVYTNIKYLSETDDTIVDVMELMCDTDDAIINRVNDGEDEICMINAEIDDIIKELFASKPEENKEKKTEKSSKKAPHK